MDLSKLSDEELLALKEQRSTANQKVDLSQLSDSELLKLKQERLKEKELEEKMPEDPAEYTMVESGLMGAAQGATLGFADELGGAVKTAAQVVTGDATFSQVNELYKKNRDVLRSEFDKAEQANPGSYMVGDIGGGVASALIPGTVGLKGAVAAGAVAGVGRTNEEDMDDMMVSALLGGGLGAGGQGVGSLLNKGIGSLGKVLNKEAGFTLQRALGFKPAASKLELDKIASSKGFTSFDVLAEVVDEVDSNGKLIFNPLKPVDEIFNSLKAKVDDYGSDIGKILSQVDVAVGGPSVDPNYIIHRLKKNAFKDLLNSDTGAVQKSTQNFLDDLVAPSAMAQPWTLSRLWGFRKTIDAITKHTSNGGAEINTNVLKQKARSEVEKVLREAMDSLPEAQNIGARELYTQASNKFRVLKTTEEAMHDNIILKEEGFMGALRKAVSLSGLGVGALAGGAMSGGNPVGMATGAVLGRAVSRGYGDLALSGALRKAGAVASSNTRIAEKIVRSASVSQEAFQNAISYAEANYDLSVAKIQRNSADVQKRLPQILAILDEESPDAAKMLRDAVDSGDTNLISGVMNGIAQNSKAAQLIEPGVGWDGKAISEGDIKTVQAQIKNAPISSVDKAQMMQKFKGDRIIPQIQQQKPFWKTYDPTLKKKIDK